MHHAMRASEGEQLPSHAHCLSTNIATAALLEWREFLQPIQRVNVLRFQDISMPLTPHSNHTLETLRPHIEPVRIREGIIVFALYR